MKRALFVFLLLLAPSLCLGQEPPPPQFSITATDSVPLGQFVLIEVSLPPDHEGLLLRVRRQQEGEDHLVEPTALLELKEPFKFAFSTPNPGRYTIHASAFDTKAKRVVDAYAVVAIEGVGPNPPRPTPPTPVVVGSKLLVILYESSQDTPQWSAFLTTLRRPDSAAAKYLQEKGHQLLILDKDLMIAKAYTDLVAKKGVSLPALVILDLKKQASLDGSVVEASPTTEEAFLEAVRKAGG